MDEAPIIGAEPVRHGQWRECVGDSRLMCSVCKGKEYGPTINGEPIVWDCCPNCGAKMNWEAEDELQKLCNMTASNTKRDGTMPY